MPFIYGTRGTYATPVFGPKADFIGGRAGWERSNDRTYSAKTRPLRPLYGWKRKGKKFPRGILTRYGGVSRMELKTREGFLDGQVAWDANAAVITFNTISQGTADTQRVGNQATMKSINLKLSFLPQATSIDARYRVMIVYDRQPNGTQANPTDILNANKVNGMNNLDNRFRFRKLYDSGVFPLGGFGSTNQRSMAEIEVYIKCHAAIQFSGTGGAFGDIVTGALMFVIIGSSTTAAGSHAWSSRERIRFVDGRASGGEWFSPPKIKGGQNIIAGDMEK